MGFLSFVSDALRADPYGGGFAVDNPYIYDAATAKGRPNVSQTQAGQYIQFVNPITERPAYSGFTPDGSLKVFAGNDVLQADRVRQAVNLGQQSGALTQADANRILTAISSPDKFREITGNADPTANTLYALLSDPKATVMVNTLGIQVGEDANASLAMAETAARQKIVDRAREQTGQDINPSTLLQADVAKEMGVKFPFTKENLTIDPATGKPIRTMMTAEDVYKNLFTELNIPTDKELKNILLTPPGGVTPGGGTPTTPSAVVGTTGDFRGLAFPEAHPTTIGETPAMLGFQPYTLTQAGSGQQKTTEPKPVIPTTSATADPVTGALLGSVIASMLPGSQSNILNGLGDVISGAGDVIGKGVDTVKNILNSKDGGLATPLMKEGGMVQNYADGGFSQITSGLGSFSGGWRASRSPGAADVWRRRYSPACHRRTSSQSTPATLIHAPLRSPPTSSAMAVSSPFPPRRCTALARTPLTMLPSRAFTQPSVVTPPTPLSSTLRTPPTCHASRTAFRPCFSFSRNASGPAR